MTISANFPNLQTSLLLDFANTKALDPRITFSRPTTATYYDNHTTVVAEQNLLLYSQGAYNNSSYWQLVSATVVDNSVTAPDGTTTASQVTATAINGRIPANSVNQTALISGATYTMSLYVKLVSGTGTFQFYDGNSFSGTFTATTSWQRFTYTFTSASANTAYRILQILTSGDVLNIWGAQLEQRSSVTAYQVTTTSAITNYIPVLLTQQSNEARFDHNPTTRESLGLLIEEQRTNLRTYSQDLSNAAWTKTRSSVTVNANIAPDGTQTACLVVEDTSTNTHLIFGSNTTVANSGSYTVSFYAKAGGRPRIQIVFDAYSGNGGGTTTIFNLSTGTVFQQGSATAATITSVGNNWYRCTMTVTSTLTSSAPQFYLDNGSGASYTGDGYSGVYIWGAQLEAGAFATSYIPTVASQVTRSADFPPMTGTNFSSWFNQAQGTVYSEISSFTTSGNRVGWQIDSGSGFTDRFVYNQSSSAMTTQVGGSTQSNFSIPAPSAKAYTKNAFAYSPNLFNDSYNGTAFSPVTSGSIPTVSRLILGDQASNSSSLNGWIKKFAYYPVACTSAQLSALTGS